MDNRWAKITYFLPVDAMPGKATMCFVLELYLKANGF